MTGGAARAAAATPLAKGRRWSDLTPRILSALVMAAAAIATAISGGHAFTLFWLLAAAAILWEWQHLIGGERVWPRVLAGAAALAIATPLAGAGQLGTATLVLAVGLAAVAVVSPAAQRWAAAAGLVYAAALALAVVVLRASFPGGLEAVLWLFAVVWGTDVGAYFAGRLLGGPKLWPRLSPKKTWSGLLVGIALGAGLGAMVAPAGAARPAVVALGLMAGLLAQGGDLFESALKRRYDVKDTGRLIPGHGGVMDRLDGFVVAAVFAAVVGAARAGVAAAGAGLFAW